VSGFNEFFTDWILAKTPEELREIENEHEAREAERERVHESRGRDSELLWEPDTGRSHRVDEVLVLAHSS
jgi:hypothetical protein